MKNLILILLLLTMVGAARAAESEDIIADQEAISQALESSDTETKEAYNQCLHDNEEGVNCESEHLGDIYN